MYVNVKVCGLTNIADAQAAIRSGADMLGFIIYPRSPRFIPPQQVADLLDTLRAWWRNQEEAVPTGEHSISAFPTTVGVFVNAPTEYVEKTVRHAGLNLAQLHGDESEETVSLFQGRAFKAIRPADRRHAVQDAERFAGLGPVDGPQLLLDAYDPHAYGGTGKRADWTTARDLTSRYGGILLAGGLTPDNVGQAIALVRPWGVDVGSGVESQPGQKDHDLIRHFVNAVRVAQTTIASGEEEGCQMRDSGGDRYP